MTATLALQNWIDAKQRVETLTYGLRALTGRSNAIRANDPDELRRITINAHARQIAAATALAEEMLGHGIYSYDEFTLRRLLKQTKEALAEATAAKKALGTQRQLRLALAKTETPTLIRAALDSGRMQIIHITEEAIAA